MRAAAITSAAAYRRLSDEELVHRYVHKQEEIAVNYLFERYAHLVFGICMNYMNDSNTAIRATEDIFIKLLDELKRYAFDSFKPWLYNRVNTHCMMETRKEIAIKNNAFMSVQKFDYNDNGLMAVEDEHLPEVLEIMIKELPEEQQKCIKLFYSEKLSYKEIEKKIGYPAQQVKILLQNGRHYLKTKISELKTVNR